MNVQGVGQLSCVRWYMKKLMMPPTIKLDSSWMNRRPWNGMRGYTDGAVLVRRSNMLLSIFAIVSAYLVSSGPSEVCPQSVGWEVVAIESLR